MQSSKSLDVSRLVTHSVETRIGLAANTRKTLSGVTSADLKCYVMERTNGVPVLYSYVPAGRFEIDFNAYEDLVIWFEPVIDATVGGPDISILEPLRPTVVRGDPETSYTDLTPRPAINPELNAVLRQMKLMHGEMRTISKENSRLMHIERGRSAAAAAAARQSPPAPSDAPPAPSAPPAPPAPKPSAKEIVDAINEVKGEAGS